MPLTIQTISHKEAQSLVSAAEKSASKHGVPAAIAVVDHGGHLVMLSRLDGTMNAAASIAIGKAATSVDFRRETIKLEDVIQNGRIAMLGLNGATTSPYVPLMGGYPIIVNGQLIGGIAVSGTMDAKMDEVVVLEALNEFVKDH